MLDLLIFILTNSGISVIVTKSYLFNNTRNYIKNKSKFFGELFNCPLCLGFWSSIFAFFLTYKHIYFDIKTIISFCFIGSITSLLIYSIIKK